MGKIALVKPVENIDTADETIVLGVIHHLMPLLSSWRKSEDLRQELEQAKERSPLADQALANARTSQAAASTAYQAAKNRDFTGGAIAMLILGIGAAFFTLLAVYRGTLQPGWIAAGAIFSVVSSSIGMSKAKEAANIIKGGLAKAFAETEALLAQADSNCKGVHQQIRQLGDDIKAREVGFPVIRLTPLEFVLRSAEVSGHIVLLDLSQSHGEVQLKAVDVSAMEEDLSQISDKVNALLSVPPLLTPNESAQFDDPVHQLFGEEQELQQLVSQFTLGLGKLRDVNLALPLVPQNSVLVHRATKSILPNAFDGAHLRVDSNINPEVIDQFVNQVRNNRDRGRALFDELSEIFSNLGRVCQLYAQARITSVNTLHNNLLGVLNSASWCSRRFYCPRTIQSPQYIEDLLGIRLANAHLLSLDDLIKRLRKDTEINKRLQSKPELEDMLSHSYQAVQEFIDGTNFDAEGRRLDQGQRPKHIESQFEEAVQCFSQILQKIMTGSTYPILNFSAESQLYFDPDNQEWASNVSPYVYSSGDAIRYGSVVKAYSDLMLPLWEHLWTEKADFRKSELFRTNEEMRRMTEKESEKLIDIANQFRADMRSVRENVYLLESDLRSKYSEIISFRDSMNALGLMSDRAAEAVSDNKLKNLVVGDSALSIAERYETILGTLPQAQAERRGIVHDPIDLIREPDALLPQPPGHPNRLLSA